MRNIIIVILIVSWWFLLSSGLYYLYNDVVISELGGLGQVEGNTTFEIASDTDAFNVTNVDDTPTSENILDMTIRMFTLRIPTTLLPSGWNIFLNFINWLLFLVFLIVLWRLIWPTTG